MEEARALASSGSWIGRRSVHVCQVLQPRLRPGWVMWLGSGGRNAGTYAAAFERWVVASRASPASFVHLQLCAQQTRGRINNFDMQIRICYVCQQLEWGVLIGVFYFERITWLKQTFTGNRRRPWVSSTTDTRIIFLWWKKWVCYLRLGTLLCAVFISYEGYDYNKVKLL